jgi:hypothetical protein
MNAAEYAEGFKGIETRSIDGTDFKLCYDTVREVIKLIRKERRTFSDPRESSIAQSSYIRCSNGMVSRRPGRRSLAGSLS